MKDLEFYLPDEMINALEEIQEIHGVSLSEIIEKSVKEFWGKYKNDIPGMKEEIKRLENNFQSNYNIN